MDVLAPGAKIFSPNHVGGWGDWSGTSQACPHVSGLAALMLEKNSSLFPYQIEEMLKNSGVDIYDEDNSGNNGTGSYLTFPRIDALSAIDAEIPPEKNKVCYVLYNKGNPEVYMEVPFISLLNSLGYQVEYNTADCNYDTQDIIDKTANFSGYGFFAHSWIWDNNNPSPEAKEYYVDQLGVNELILGEDVGSLDLFGYSQSEGYSSSSNSVYVIDVGEILPSDDYAVGQGVQIYTTSEGTQYSAYSLDLVDGVTEYLDDGDSELDGYVVMGTYENANSGGKMGFFGLGEQLVNSYLTDYSDDEDNALEVTTNLANWLTPTQQPEHIDITFIGGTIDFGNSDPDNETAALNNDNFYVRVEDTTNVNVDIYQKGEDYSLSGGGDSIAIDNMKYNTDGLETKTSVSSTYTKVYENKPIGDYPFYYWLYVPSGKLAGVYNSIVYFSAVKTGGAAPTGGGSGSSVSDESAQSSQSSQPSIESETDTTKSSTTTQTTTTKQIEENTVLDEDGKIIEETKEETITEKPKQEGGASVIVLNPKTSSSQTEAIKTDIDEDEDVQVLNKKTEISRDEEAIRLN